MLRSIASLTLAGALAASAAACGSSVTSHDADAGGVGGAGSAQTGPGPAGTGGAITTGSSTQAGPGPGPAGTGGGALCGETHEGLEMAVALFDGSSWGCALGAGSQLGETKLEGQIVSSDAMGSFELDSCPPNADCVPLLSKISVSAPGLSAYVPPGAFVELRIMVDQPWGCINAIQIKNLASWGGEPNPVASGSLLWLTAVDGSPMTFPDTPFGVQQQALGCYPGEPPGCDVHEDFQLFFYDVDDASNPGVAVPMGATTGFSFVGAGQPEHVTIKNLRSYSSGNCDDYWNWAYFAVQALLGG